jgi:hypothetical protein
VVDEAPRADQSTAEIRQQPAHDGGLAECDFLALEDLVHRARGDVRESAEIAQIRRAIKVAHATTLRPPDRPPSELQLVLPLAGLAKINEGVPVGVNDLGGTK